MLKPKVKRVLPNVYIYIYKYIGYSKFVEIDNVSDNFLYKRLKLNIIEYKVNFREIISCHYAVRKPFDEVIILNNCCRNENWKCL